MHLIHLQQYVSDQMRRRLESATAYRLARLARASGDATARQLSCAARVPAGDGLRAPQWA